MTARSIGADAAPEIFVRAPPPDVTPLGRPLNRTFLAVGGASPQTGHSTRDGRTDTFRNLSKISHGDDPRMPLAMRFAWSPPDLLHAPTFVPDTAGFAPADTHAPPRSADTSPAPASNSRPAPLVGTLPRNTGTADEPVRTTSRTPSAGSAGGRAGDRSPNVLELDLDRRSMRFESTVGPREG